MAATSKQPISLLQQIESLSTELNSELSKPSKLGTTGALQLSRQLVEFSGQYHETLRVLSLSNAGLTSEGLIALLEALYPPSLRYGPVLGTLASYTNLHSLILKGNVIGARGVKALAQVLLQDVKLVNLDLYDNALGNAAVRPLLEVLRSNRTLKTLNLWYNRLNTDLAPQLASMVKYNCGIVKLALGGNDLGDGVCSALRMAVQTNVTIMDIEMSGNTMSQASLDSLAVILKHNALRRKILRHMADAGSDHCHVPLAPDSPSNSGTSRRNSSTEHLDALSMSPEEARHGTFVFLAPRIPMDGSPGGTESSPPPASHHLDHSPSSSAAHTANTPSSSSTPSSTHATPPSPRIEGAAGTSSSSSATQAFLSIRLPLFLAPRADLITRLCLSGNHLQDLPLEVCNLPRLTHLDLRSNSLQTLPSEIQLLSGLKSLLISHNRLESLPDALVLLNQLEVWALHSNPLSLIPKIYLENSVYADQPQKSALWRYLYSIRLGGSQELKLQKAKVMIVGDANVGKTSLLHCLQTDFGSFLSRWSHRLPKPLATDGIDIEAVKIRTTPTGTTGAGGSAGRQSSSMMSIANTHSTSPLGLLSQSALPLSPPLTPPSFDPGVGVGVGGGGAFYGPLGGSAPASLSVSPIGTSSALNSGTSTSMTYPLATVSPQAAPSASAINYDVWDFAGQDVYYTTHSFFLTPNTIYLVVFDLSRNDEVQMSRIDYWIQSIQTRAGTSLSYILLVGTHTDDSGSYAPQLISKLTRRWVVSRDVLALCTVSCKNGQGIEALKTTLNATATKFGLASQVYPKSWLQIGEVLKGLMMTQPWISYEKLNEISRQFYVSSSTLDLGVLPALKDLGIVLHFSPDPQLQDTVFINPQFIIKAFADVLTIKHRGFIKSDGVLLVKDLHHLWQDERRLFNDSSLIKLFELFDVAIRLNESRLLVPALLNDDAPRNLNEFWPHGLGSQADLSARPERVFFRRNYKFKFLPLGFFPKLIAQCYRNMNWDVTCHWKAGIVCRSRDGEIALATYDEHSFLLQLRIDGKRYSSVLTHFVLLVDTLIKGWYPNANCTVTVPIPTEDQMQFYYVPREEIIDAVRMSSEIKAIISVPSVIEGEQSASPRMVNHRIDLVAPDLALAGLKQLSVMVLDECLERGELIGKGGQGRVFAGTFEGAKVAIKDFDVAVMAHPEDFDTQQEWLNHQRAAIQRAQLTLQHETLILKNARHPNIVRIVGFNIHRLTVILEFIALGHLESYIHHNLSLPEANSSENISIEASESLSVSDELASLDVKQKMDCEPGSIANPALKVERQVLDPKLQIRIALDIASAMAYLHSLKPAILHRDLAANNIMLESLSANAPVVAKLVDFGSASFVGKSGLGSYNNEKRYCMSPEVLQGRDHSHKSDVYSFSILLWQMYRGVFQHELSPNEIQRGARPSLELKDGKEEVFSNFSKSSTWINAPERSRIAYAGLIQRSWDASPDARPEFHEIIAILAPIAIELGIDPSIVASYTERLDSSANASSETEEEATEAGPRQTGSSGTSSRQIAVWHETVLFSIDDELSATNPDVTNSPYSSTASVPTDSFLALEITAIASQPDHGLLLLGLSDGMLCVHPLNPDSEKSNSVQASLGDSSVETANRVSIAVFEAPIVAILPMRPSCIVCLSSMAISLVDVEKRTVLKTIDFLAGTAVCAVSRSHFLVATSVGTLHLWTIDPLERIGSTYIPNVEKIISFIQFPEPEDFSLHVNSSTSSGVLETVIAVTETALFEIGYSPFKATLVRLNSHDNHSMISSGCFSQDQIWIGFRDGSIKTFKIETTEATSLCLTNTFKLHSKPVTFIGSAIEAEDNGRMLSIGGDDMLFWNPDSLQFLEKPIRFGPRTPIQYAIIESGTSILTVKRHGGLVVRWVRPLCGSKCAGDAS
jgi:Leucine-rich repeat (LRR) protein